MPAKFFGEYLLGKGAITREMLLEAVKLQQSIARPLCAMAIEKGFLTEEQLATLDAEIEASDGDRVQVQVNREGVLSLASKSKTGGGMSDKGLFLAEALAQKGYLKLADLQRHFVAYKKQVVPEDKQFWMYQKMREKILPHVPLRDVISVFLQVSIDSFVESTKQSIDMREVSVDMDMRFQTDFVFDQHVYGEKDFHFVLALPESITIAIASYMSGRLCADVDDMTLDACAEFLNIVLGKALRQLSFKEYALFAEAPRITKKDMMRTRLGSHCIALQMKTTIDDFFIMFFFDEWEDAPPA